MKINIKILWLCLLYAIFVIKNSDAMEVSSKQLIEHSKFYDGKVVTYSGEAVTAGMKRGDYGWINVSDTYNAIGVWCNASLIEQVRFFGGYKTKGDILEVSGIFNMACQEHGGDLDIHADTVRVGRTGKTVQESIDKKKVYIVSALFLIGIVTVLVFRKRI